MSSSKGLYEAFYEEINTPNIEDLIKKISYKSDLIVLNSAKSMTDFGEYSFICFDSFANFLAKNEQFFWNNQLLKIDNPFDFLSEKIAEYSLKKNPELPDFQGGVAGYFGYEACHYLEKLPKLIDNIVLPDIYLNFYSSIIVINHKNNKSWIVSTGFPEKNKKLRELAAKKNILRIKNILNAKVKRTNIDNHKLSIQGDLHSNFSQKSYEEAVSAVQEYIINGDIFEANIAQQFSGQLANCTDFTNLYLTLTKINPAPFAAIIKLPNQGWIISASPERFIKLSDKKVEACPIKGTRKRSKNSYEDKLLATELLQSQKDQAENIMIVDLMRNDLSKVCNPGSIKVAELCALKSFERVHHLVSKINGTLKENKHAFDLLKASFPPGSITGAPKIRAMEIISALEKQTRGPYCGIIGYFSFTGDMDSAVTIRTYCINKDKVYFSAGGAVVLESDPTHEYYESLSKAEALIEAITL